MRNLWTLLFIVCFLACARKEEPVPPGQSERTFFIIFDAQQQGRALKNIFSDVNMWDFRQNWTSVADGQPADYFQKNYPAIERVQFMTATGGNEQRDLLVDPLDNSNLTDYKFDEIIHALHNVTGQGLKPMVKTGAVPLKYSDTPATGGFGVNTRSPYDYNLYYDYIRALAEAVVAEFGLEEVKTWTWGVLVEYENKDWFVTAGGNPDSTKVAYFKLYDYTVAALEDVIGAQNLTVGAHSMTVAEGLWDEREFIDHVAKGINYATGGQGTQIDYLAASYYDRTPGVPVDGSLTLEETINLLRDRAEQNGLTGLQYGIDEGRILFGPNDDQRPLVSRIVPHTFQASADARMYKLMNEIGADWISNWGLSTQAFWGGVPAVSTHIANLTYKMTGEQQIGVATDGQPVNAGNEIDGIGSYNSGSNTVHLLVFNYNSDYNAEGGEEPVITVDNIAAVSGNEVTVKQWLIDDDHANYWPQWFKDMNERGMTNDDFTWSKYSLEAVFLMKNQADRDYWYSRENFYKSLAALDSTVTSMQVTGNKIVLEPELGHHGVVFYQIENVQPSP